MASLHCLWCRVRAPFDIPESCHRCTLSDWEVFDVDKAGCRTCGRFHLCQDGGKCVVFNGNDYQACEITGCWIKSRNFQQGYTDTAMPISSQNSDLMLTQKPWIEGDHIVHWLHTLVFSDTARRCIGREIQRVTDKASAAFARVAKAWKLDRRDPDILGMFAQTRFVMGSLRVPCKVLDQKAFDELAHSCVLAILGFTGNFKKVLMPHVPPAKIDHFVIGLIYLLRSGIVMFDTMQVIPRIPVLRRLLPMETCLKAHFRIPCKIITEVENITKIALKSLDRRRLKGYLCQ